MTRWLSNGHASLKCSPGWRSDATTRPKRSFMPTSPGPTVKMPLPSQSSIATMAAPQARPRAVTRNPVVPATLSRSQTHSSGTRVRHMLTISSAGKQHGAGDP